MSSVLGLDADQEGVDPSGRVQVWLIDARRPWNLGNVFGGDPVAAVNGVRAGRPEVVNGRIEPTYRPGQGGIIVYDDGDIDEELKSEREAYCELYNMQGLEDYESESGDSGDDSDDNGVASTIEGDRTSKKRKSWSDREDEDDEGQDEARRPRQRQRSHSVRLRHPILTARC